VATVASINDRSHRVTRLCYSPRGNHALMKFDVESSTLWASLLWGSIGTGFWIYGWKQKNMVACFAGVALIAISYFIDSSWLMSVVAVAIILAMIWIKKNY
jgi:hypothetical protein